MKEKAYTYKRTVVYQDLLLNKYTQEIVLSYQLTYSNNKQPEHKQLKIEVADEQLTKNIAK